MQKINSGITLLGLGPGDPDLITREAWNLLNTSPEIYARTRRHAVLEALPEPVQVHSFDELFESGETLDAIHGRIVVQMLELARKHEVIYAVPGHPLFADAIGVEILRLAQAEGIVIHVVQGVSFLDSTFSALGLDPLPHTVLVDAMHLARLHVPAFPPSVPAILPHVDSPRTCAEVKRVLLAVYPSDHPVQLVHAPGAAGQQVEAVRLDEIDRSAALGPLSVLYLPALAKEASFEAFQEIIAHLRAPDGCPWDREQTHASLRPYLLEEAYEALTALDEGDPAAMREEFGDLLLQVVLHAQIAAESGEFNMANVLRGIHVKIVQRHPHVFGDVQLEDSQAVLQNWERLKEKERAASRDHRTSMFDGIARALPALSQAEEIQRRAARVGFDWPEIQGVIDKVHEEMGEVHDASDQESQAAEIGDLLFAVVNLARWYGVDAESALREASTRFRRRFASIEQSAQDQGKSIADFSLEEMEALWQSAKKLN
jgi:tetrapyrrole methylase family protein/MazG family protein